MNEVTLSTPEELVEALNKHPNNFIFRGQSDARWGLTSSLERLLEGRWNEDAFDIKKYEDFSLKRFFSKSHLYSDHSSKPESKFEQLSLMQHFGTPTRLVDFTESPYFALYFALETYAPSLEKDFALYALDYSAMMEISIEKIQQLDNQFKEDRTSLDDKKDEVFDEIVDRFSFDLLWISEPRRMNKRLDLQAGTFLTSINRMAPIEQAIANPIYAEVEITKYIISSKLYETAYALLRKANITSKSVYGDLAGLGSSVRMELQAYT
jgi:hypothetical protein